MINLIYTLIQNNNSNLFQLQKIRIYSSLIFFLTAIFHLTACKMNNSAPNNDLDSLNKIVRIETNLQAARWEIFTTPEYQQGVPGPTDYISLVLEVEKPIENNTSKNAQSGLIWIAPEAARPWMTRESILFIENLKNQTVDLSRLNNCNKIFARLVKSNKKIEGIFCQFHTSSFMYFVLEDHT